MRRADWDVILRGYGLGIEQKPGFLLFEGTFQEEWIMRFAWFFFLSMLSASTMGEGFTISSDAPYRYVSPNRVGFNMEQAIEGLSQDSIKIHLLVADPILLANPSHFFIHAEYAPIQSFDSKEPATQSFPLDWGKDNEVTIELSKLTAGQTYRIRMAIYENPRGKSLQSKLVYDIPDYYAVTLEKDAMVTNSQVATIALREELLWRIARNLGMKRGYVSPETKMWGYTFISWVVSFSDEAKRMQPVSLASEKQIGDILTVTGTPINFAIALGEDSTQKTVWVVEGAYNESIRIHARAQHTVKGVQRSAGN